MPLQVTVTGQMPAAKLLLPILNGRTIASRSSKIFENLHTRSLRTLRYAHFPCHFCF